jgi:segregation and condensation protein A
VSYEVKTRVFEGPLDLLLQLITSHQVDIVDLSLGRLVTEYLDHLDAMRAMDLEVTSEFLLIAATLIQLKVRYLLPGESTVEIDEDLELAEERDRLLSRLLACLTFKDVAAVLAHRIAGHARYVPRLAGLDPDVVPVRPQPRVPVDAHGLAAIAARVTTRRREEPELDHLDLELPSVEAAMADIRGRLAGETTAEFDTLVAHCERDVEVIAYFLALLELARWGVVTVNQDRPDAPITVGRDPAATPSFDLETEWG